MRRIAANGIRSLIARAVAASVRVTRFHGTSRTPFLCFRRTWLFSIGVDTYRFNDPRFTRTSTNVRAFITSLMQTLISRVTKKDLRVKR